MAKVLETEMVDVAGGTFLMGSSEFYAEETPVHSRVVAPFALDRAPVTNAGFAAFVEDTGYVTVAERPLDPVDYPGVAENDLLPGAMVFTPTNGPVDLSDWRQWWRWETGAHWRQPFGRGSTVADRMDHPVVNVAFEDATTYAAWAGKRLPTEAEWEWAARGGLVGARFAWGDEARINDHIQANTWQGGFPFRNDGAKGWVGTSPVGTFPANGYGLVDMIGNVWEWTSTYWAHRHAASTDPGVDAGGRPNLLGTGASAAGVGAVSGATAAGEQSAEPGSRIARRVLKGGSHLCAPEYCLRYRPAARSAQAEDTAMTHIGFRCAR